MRSCESSAAAAARARPVRDRVSERGAQRPSAGRLAPCGAAGLPQQSALRCARRTALRLDISSGQYSLIRSSAGPSYGTPGDHSTPLLRSGESARFPSPSSPPWSGPEQSSVAAAASLLQAAAPSS